MNEFNYINSFTNPKLAEKINSQLRGSRQTSEEAAAEKAAYRLEFFREGGVSGFRVLAPEGRRPAPSDWCLQGDWDAETAAATLVDQLDPEDAEQFCLLFDRTPEFKLRR